MASFVRFGVCVCAAVCALLTRSVVVLAVTRQTLQCCLPVLMRQTQRRKSLYAQQSRLLASIRGLL